MELETKERVWKWLQIEESCLESQLVKLELSTWKVPSLQAFCAEEANEGRIDADTILYTKWKP